MNREIVLDTETTGLDPKVDKIIEIGCVEMINGVQTGNSFHKYINPGERKVTEGAYSVHGISNDMLKGKPTFSEIADEFLAYLGDNYVFIIHNAPFDMGFLRSEFSPMLDFQADVLDTLRIAKSKFPGERVNLDALCKKFNISLESRTMHGALIDAKLLADVYNRLIDRFGQTSLDFISSKNNKRTKEKKLMEPRGWAQNTEELKQHEKFIEDKITNTKWND